ncbi:MAG: protein-L-isoaspartate(D-aspartate) O-methyltransferase [Aestuariivirga sp.]|uniref:protein-L-isoaspartate(D-aspartate) O-methyltransferase n=1 Tax=Aestuariivirga sp. TaxID=2650926 RepID=UPI0038D15863
MSEDRRRTLLLKALRAQGIADERVLAAIARVPREAFVEQPFADQAYADQALPISCGQTISQPYVVALMTEALRVEAPHRVLEIGTGSGYQTAVLSQLCKDVYTIERFRSLAEAAEERFIRLGLFNITRQVGDGTEGMPEGAPFDRIMVTAAARQIPEALLQQLGPGGIMVAPVEERPGKQNLWRITRGEQGFTSEHLMPVRFVPLVEGLPGGG